MNETMEGLLLIILIVVMFLTIIGTVVYLLQYVGYFHRIRVQTGPSIVSEIHVAYKYHIGNYSTCGMYFEELTALCPNQRTIGIYYDDPKKVDPYKCRYIVGVILTNGTNQKPDPETLKVLEEKSYQFLDFPKVDFSVKTTHPFPIAISAHFGATKAYPALEKYIKEEKLCAHPFIEIYDDDIIHYMAPLSKQADFYIDEVRDLL